MGKEKRELDHKVWQHVRQSALYDKRILVALSGGADSTALLRALSKVQRQGLMAACYYHHGEDSNHEYREAAKEFCAQLCHELSVPFFALHASDLSRSEAGYRESRYTALRELMLKENFDVLATGHHRDDLLETRLLRLIRGTGGQGLTSMEIFKEKIFRPFLEVGKEELKKYLEQEKVVYLEDPTNESQDLLRNWVREEWLKSLDQRVPGATGALARSLETIVNDLEARPWGDLLTQNEVYKSQGISRAFYLTLTPTEQKRLLAQYLFSNGKRDFSQAHIEEVRKRLDNSQKEITFLVGGCEWRINAEQIVVQS